MVEVTRRGLLAATGGAVAGGVAGCNAGGTDGREHAGGGTEDGSDEAALRGPGDDTGQLPDQLATALGSVTRPSGVGPEGQLELFLSHPPAFEDGSEPAGGPMELGDVEWAIEVDRTASGAPHALAVGEFGDADPTGAPGVEPAGDVGALDRYAFHDWYMAVGDQYLVVGPSEWIEHVLDARNSDEAGVLDSRPSVADLLGAVAVAEASRGLVVLEPADEAVDPQIDPTPDAFAWATEPLDAGQSRQTMAYGFESGYDDETVEAVERSFTTRFDVASVAVTERESTIVLDGRGDTADASTTD